MPGNFPWIVILIIPLAGIASPLVAKWMENRHQRKLKTLEVMLNRKLDSYNDYIKRVAEFGYKAPKDSPEYNDYLRSYYGAKLVASPQIKKAMEKVAFEANKLRAAGGFESVSGAEISWQDAVDNVVEEMTKEIEELIK